MKISWSELHSLKKSFSFALKGLVYCIKNERNMRIHLFVAVVVLFFAIIFKLSKIEFIILILTFGLVLFCEVINTSIETFINLTSPAYSGLAKIAKDVAAGGVFLTAIIAVIVGIILFGNINKLISTFIYIFKNPLILLAFLAIIFLGLVFVFKSFNFMFSNMYRKMVDKDEENVKIYKPKKRNKFNL